MELTKKTTILFSPELHEQLTRLAEARGSSLGELVREACEVRYGLVSTDERLKAVKDLAALELPVSSPEEMELESVPKPADLLP